MLFIAHNQPGKTFADEAAELIRAINSELVSAGWRGAWCSIMRRDSRLSILFHDVESALAFDDRIKKLPAGSNEAGILKGKGHPVMTIQSTLSTALTL